MLRRKSWNSVWTIVLIVTFLSPFALSRPSIEPQQDASTTTKHLLNDLTKITERPPIRSTTPRNKVTSSSPVTSSPRDVKRSTPVIGESIKMVANQLLQSTKEPIDAAAIVEDTRTPPKMKTQIANKNKTKAKLEVGKEKVENSHAGIALPVTMEDLEKESMMDHVSKETSTSHEGISTWILLSNPPSTVKPATEANKPENHSTTEATQKKPKPNKQNKPKKPQPSKSTTTKHPIIASSNKSDLVAGGSAMSENVFNKIKATVLANVQKNKNAAINHTTTISTTTAEPVTVSLITKQDFITKAPTTVATTPETVTEKVLKKKKKNKNKNKTLNIVNKESASLPMEPKDQEIELEVSTPPTTTKKPKRSSTKRKKNKTKKRKPSSTSTKTDDNVHTKIRNSTSLDVVLKPIGTQIYNYLSREVMPTVGVGIVGLAGLVGLASYFLFPFTGPVRRTLEVDKKDDLYRHNAEEYANDGNGQAEEEMLGTVLAGIPTNTQNRVNPYVNQTPVRQHTKKETDQNLRYRHVAANSDINGYNTHYSQQKTGIAHAAVYSDPIGYKNHYESKDTYPLEQKHVVYANEDQSNFHGYSPVEPIYPSSQTGPSGPSSYGSDSSNTVVYGVKPTQESSFEPVYPFEGQVFSETTINPMTYPATSMYLGSNNESEQANEPDYDTSIKNNDSKEPQFVVGNIPKEFIQSVTPAVVPEHGPRSLERKRRSIKKRSIADSLEEVLKKAKVDKNNNEISNEIDEALGVTQDFIPLPTQEISTNHKLISDLTIEPTIRPTHLEGNDAKNVKGGGISKDVTPLYPVYTVYPEQKSSKYTDGVDENSKASNEPKDGIVESISTLPLDTKSSNEETTTNSYGTNDIEYTTKTFRVYEVFPSSTQQSFVQTETTNKAVMDVMTTERSNIDSLKTDISSSAAPPIGNTVSSTPKPITNKPLNDNRSKVPSYTSPGMTQSEPDSSFFGFMKRLIEFKFRLGMSILQTTSDSLTRYLKRMDSTVQRVAKASESQYYYN